MNLIVIFIIVLIGLIIFLAVRKRPSSSKHRSEAGEENPEAIGDEIRRLRELVDGAKPRGSSNAGG